MRSGGVSRPCAGCGARNPFRYDNATPCAPPSQAFWKRWRRRAKPSKAVKTPKEATVAQARTRCPSTGKVDIVQTILLGREVGVDATSSRPHYLAMSSMNPSRTRGLAAWIALSFIAVAAQAQDAGSVSPEQARANLGR